MNDEIKVMNDDEIRDFCIKKDLKIFELEQEIERLNKCYCERTDCSGRIKNGKKYESMQEENERLRSIIKEVREYFENHTFDYDDLMLIKPSDALEILDKENKE